MINKMFLLGALVVTGVAGFSGQNLHATRTGGVSTIQLSMSSSSESSRRDILSNAASVAALGLTALVVDPNDASALNLRTDPPTAQSVANKAAESYQGVYTDPMHPEGYRVIMASGKDATMTISDGVAKDAPEGTEEKTYKNVPVGVKGNELSFDFGFKGGPKGVVAKLSDDKQSITFPDGNTWTKNANQYDGIYKDPKYPKGYRIVRKVKGTKILTEINDTGNPQDSKFIRGKSGSLFSIPTTAFTFYEFSGTEAAPPKKPEDIVSAALSALPKGEDAQDTTVVGQFSLQDNNSAFPYGTITFPDKTVWTRI